MEIELHDGTILQAPEGSDPSVVAKGFLRTQKINQLRASNPGEYDPSSPEFQQKYGPTGTNLQNFLAGAGKAPIDMGRGIKQLSLGVADLVSPRQQNLSDLVTGKPVSRYDEYAKNIDAINQQDAPLMNTKAGLGGNIAGNIASIYAGGTALQGAASAAGLGRTASVLGQLNKPTSLLGAAAGGAALGGLQPVGENGSRVVNSGLGAAGSAAGYGLGKAISHLVKPVQSIPEAGYQKAVDRLSENGVPMDAAQQTGSEKLQSLKRMLTDNPLTHTGQVAQADKVATAFDRAALSTIGETADVANEAVMSRAANRIGGVMDDIAKRNPVKIDNKLLDSITEIAQKSSSELESSQAKVIANQVDEILAKETNGAIEGQAYKSLRESLGRLQSSSDSGVKHWSGQLKNALDDALTRSASPEDSAALKAARVQWRNLEGISKVIGSQEGQHISPAKLANALNTKGYGGNVAMVRGKGATDLMRLAKAGSTVLADRFPQSGTAPRAALQLLLPGAIGAGYGYAKEGDTTGALKYGLGGVAAPIALQKLLNSPAGISYLSKGIPGLNGATAQIAGGIFGPAMRYGPATLAIQQGK